MCDCVDCRRHTRVDVEAELAAWLPAETVDLLLQQNPEGWASCIDVVARAMDRVCPDCLRPLTTLSVGAGDVRFCQPPGCVALADEVAGLALLGGDEACARCGCDEAGCACGDRAHEDAHGPEVGGV